MPLARPWIEGRLARYLLQAIFSLTAMTALVCPAQAADWELMYRLREFLRGSDNIGQIENPDGPAGSSHSSLGFDLKAHTKTLDWTLSGDAGYLVYFGEDPPDSQAAPNISAKSDLLKKTRDTDYTSSAFFSVAPASTTALTELGIFEERDIERLSYGASGGLVHRLNKRDSLNFAVRASRIDFSETSDGVTPSTYVESSLGWTRKMTRRVNGHLRTSVAWQQEENDTDTENLIYRITLGSDAKVTRRLNVDVNVGVSVTDQYELDPLFPLAGRMRDILVSFNGGFAFVYTPRSDTNVQLSFSQLVAPDDLGDLRQTQSVRGSVSHQINDRSSVSLSAGFTNSTGSSDDTDSEKTFNISPRYIHKATRYWNAIFGYQFVMTDDGGGVRKSNSIFMTLSHSGTLLP